MRRYRDRQPTGLFRGNELARLMTMVVMLGVLAMMFRRARDEDTWRFFTGEPTKLETDSGKVRGPLKPHAPVRRGGATADSIIVSAPEVDAELAMPLTLPAPKPAAAAPPALDAAAPPTRALDPSLALAAADPQTESPAAVQQAGDQQVSAPQAGAQEVAEQQVADQQPAAGEDAAPELAAQGKAADPAAPAQEPAASDTQSPVEPALSSSDAPSSDEPATNGPSSEPAAQAAPAGDSAAASAEPQPGAAPADADASPPNTSGQPVKKPPGKLYRPHLPANPENYLDPNSVPAAPPLEPGPIDEDEQERQAFEHEVEAISDRTPIGKEEMFAYWRLLRWAQSQTTDEMLKRARGDVRYGELLEHPEDYRGDLIRVKLHVVRVLEFEAPPDIPLKLHHYYQAIGWNDASQSWFYHCVFEDLPEGMKLGERVYEEGTFVGYFFKNLVYLDGKGTKTKSPVLIGRMVFHPSPSMAHNPNEWMWSWAIGGVLLVLFVARWGWRLTHPRKSGAAAATMSRRLNLNDAGEPAVPINDWLEQAQAPSAEIKSQGRTDSNGSAYGNGLPLERDHGLDWTADGER